MAGTQSQTGVACGRVQAQLEREELRGGGQDGGLKAKLEIGEAVKVGLGRRVLRAGFGIESAPRVRLIGWVPLHLGLRQVLLRVFEINNTIGNLNESGKTLEESIFKVGLGLLVIDITGQEIGTDGPGIEKDATSLNAVGMKSQLLPGAVEVLGAVGAVQVVSRIKAQAERGDRNGVVQVAARCHQSDAAAASRRALLSR